MRRLRAALAIALLWALAWFPAGLALALYASGQPPQPSDVISRPVSLPQFLTVWTTWGAISGGVFALILGFTERRRTIEDLSIARTALWGSLGAVSLPAFLIVVDLIRTPAGLRGYGWGLPLLILAVSATMGACCAAGTLAVARRSTT